jgi:hypothetical protein
MLERNAPSADYYLQRVQELDRALLRYVQSVHDDGHCGFEGRHRASAQLCSINLDGTRSRNTSPRWKRCYIAVLSPVGGGSHPFRRPTG